MKDNIMNLITLERRQTYLDVDYMETVVSEDISTKFLTNYGFTQKDILKLMDGKVVTLRTNLYKVK